MWVGVHQNVFEKLVLIRWHYHCDVTALFSKNDVIFAKSSQAVEVLYMGLFFDTES